MDEQSKTTVYDSWRDWRAKMVPSPFGEMRGLKWRVDDREGGNGEVIVLRRGDEEFAILLETFRAILPQMKEQGVIV